MRTTRAKTMMLRVWVVTAAIASFLAGPSALHAQNFGASPYGQPGFAPPGAAMPPAGAMPSGYGPSGFVQPAAMMQPPPDVLPPAAMPMDGGEVMDLDPVVNPVYPWRY